MTSTLDEPEDLISAPQRANWNHLPRHSILETFADICNNSGDGSGTGARW